MYRKGCLVKVLLGLLVIGLVLTVARGVGRFGWWHGYRMGQWSVQEEREAIPFRRPPLGPGVLGHYPRMGMLRALCGVGLLVKLGVVLLLVTLVSRLIGHRYWRMAYGPRWRHGPWHWRPYGPRRYGPHGPWWHGPYGSGYHAKERETFQAKAETESARNHNEG